MAEFELAQTTYSKYVAEQEVTKALVSTGAVYLGLKTAMEYINAPEFISTTGYKYAGTIFNNEIAETKPLHVFSSDTETVYDGVLVPHEESNTTEQLAQQVFDIVYEHASDLESGVTINVETGFFSSFGRDQEALLVGKQPLYGRDGNIPPVEVYTYDGSYGDVISMAIAEIVTERLSEDFGITDSVVFEDSMFQEDGITLPLSVQQYTAIDDLAGEIGFSNGYSLLEVFKEGTSNGEVAGLVREAIEDNDGLEEDENLLIRVTKEYDETVENVNGEINEVCQIDLHEYKYTLLEEQQQPTPLAATASLLLVFAATLRFRRVQRELRSKKSAYDGTVVPDKKDINAALSGKGTLEQRLAVQEYSEALREIPQRPFMDLLRSSSKSVAWFAVNGLAAAIFFGGLMNGEPDVELAAEDELLDYVPFASQCDQSSPIAFTHPDPQPSESRSAVLNSISEFVID
ncbi:TPA: hypothetical protein EYO12_02200 [Candidatus Saccharibacteria bacterium]|nr:hypothetical protein [Candidatus Saccharibacteria bacterium]HIO87527.1 hypothetical protein [Candidatus Saccharibacteria bacterium]